MTDKKKVVTDAVKESASDVAGAVKEAAGFMKKKPKETKEE